MSRSRPARVPLVSRSCPARVPLVSRSCPVPAVCRPPGEGLPFSRLSSGRVVRCVCGTGLDLVSRVESPPSCAPLIREIASLINEIASLRPLAPRPSGPEVAVCRPCMDTGLCRLTVVVSRSACCTLFCIPLASLHGTPLGLALLRYLVLVSSIGRAAMASVVRGSDALLVDRQRLL